MRRVFCGIDCGTQSTKALLLDAETLEAVSIGVAKHEIVTRSDGTSEQHPDWWVAAARTAIRQATRAAGRVELAGVGVAGQQHGLVCLGANGGPVRRAKLWNDTTSALECRRLTDALGGTSALLELTGNLMLPGYTAPQVAWLRDNEPQTYRSSLRFCLPHDYLNLWLTGTFVTEAGEASGTAYFDVRKRRYADPVLATLDPARDWHASLPPIVESLNRPGFRGDPGDWISSGRGGRL